MHRVLMIGLLALATGCAQEESAGQGEHDAAVAQSAAFTDTITAALTHVCEPSESGQPPEVAISGALEAGFEQVDEGRFRAGAVELTPGGEGMPLCDIKVFGEPVDEEALVSALSDWASNREEPLEIRDALAPFESGEDRGSRIVWTKAETVLSLYVYHNDREDGRRARLMFDAI